MNVISRFKRNNYKNNIEALDDLLIAVMICDISNFNIEFANKSSIKLLNKIEHLININPEKIVGTSIDVFHKEPARQRRILANPNNLPHQARLRLADEVIELNITPVFDRYGRYRKAALVWNIITEQVRSEKETHRLMQMINKMPINIMACDPETFRVNFTNQTSRDTLQKLKEHLSFDPSEILGMSIDAFHKNPEHQRRILSNPANLPWRTNIRVGPETLRLDVSAIEDTDGSYLGPMLSWSVISDRTVIADKIRQVVEVMDEVGGQLGVTAQSMLEMANSALGQATSVTAAAEEMTASFSEIASRMTDATDISRKATGMADTTARQIETLMAASDQIGTIMATIQSIADQTKLLALNATIEAARAGQMGRGFAVVAAEVKDLSEQTSKETEQIRSQIEAMQLQTGNAMRAIQSIISVIRELDTLSTAVAAAMSEQQAASQEVARAISSVSEASNKAKLSAEIVIGIVEQVDDVRRANAEVEVYITNN